jgi:anaerobic ribonucleoside-triphosphate reductase activating protein
MTALTLRLFGTADDSIVDGPGIRLAVFVQGCAHRCPGCHNPKAQPCEGGRAATVEELVEKVRANPLLAGVTLTGGEPFDQAEPLLAFVCAVRSLARPGGHPGEAADERALARPGGHPGEGGLTRPDGRALTVWAYSGYTFEELEAGEACGGGAAGEAARGLLHSCDVLVDGPYIEAQRSLDLRWKGSANQRVIDIPASLAAGKLQITGCL